MSHIKKFSYPDISKRRLILLSIFMTFFINSLIISELIVTLKQYLPYYPVIKTVLVTVISFIFAANILGRLLFRLIKNYRIINLAAASLLSLFAILFFAKNHIFPEKYSVINIFILSKYYIILLIAIPSFLTGILNTYFLKVSSGDFIDEKNLFIPYITLFLIASASGFYAGYLLNLHNLLNYIAGIILSFASLIIPVSLFLIKIPFNPEQLFAQSFYDEDPSSESPVVQRDDLFFTYMNFSYILIYITLGFTLFIKFFGNNYYNVLLYIISTLAVLSIGILPGRKKKASFWYVYSEMLYPVFFMVYLSLMYMFNGQISIYTGLLFSSIPVLIFGFSLEQTIKNIIIKYDHGRRFNILNFSMFILPVPILISISAINFTYSLFFIILYSLAFINLIIPGIYIFNMKMNPLNKIIYFVFSLLFLPSVMFIHLYFKIPLSSAKFSPNIENYQIIRDTDFTSRYIMEKGEVSMFGTPVFFLSDNFIRNYKRASASTALFNSGDNRTLIIDSNQKFFRNPVYSFFRNSIFIDTLSDTIADNNRLPFPGRQPYVPESVYLFEYLTENNTPFDFIIDAPNILDQNFHSYRFSPLYYRLLKNNMNASGKYASIFDLQYMDRGMLSFAAQNLKESFNHHIIFLFSNILMIISSDDPSELKIDSSSLSRIREIIRSDKNVGLLFFQDIHPLNNILFTDIDNLILFFPQSKDVKPYRYTSVTQKSLPEPLIEYYLLSEPEWFSRILKDNKENARFNRELISRYVRSGSLLNLIKRTEYAESISAYENETAYLFQLKNISSFRPELKDYINSILNYKESSYFIEAQRLEKEKRWEDAATLYRAILNINNKNFEANYRLGLLFITMQDLDNASRYLNAALQLDRNHPHVLYQMGVLMFSGNRFSEAISFLEKAESLRERNASLYMYLGLSYERLNRLEKSKENYEKAAILDPNDKKLQELLESLLIKMKPTGDPYFQSERTNMIDDEKDEEFILPVNDKAIRSRLMDDEL
jgi:tetratricopeptide (TPR) repeat protein